MKSSLWVEEKTNEYYAMKFKVKDVLFQGKSEFQSVDVVETVGHGRMLLNDGLVMTTERDEFIYHEMITHVPLLTHANPKNVLVIGGGDGGTSREVLRHETVEKCTMVEIDKMVVDACKEFLPITSKVFDNPKLDLKIEDGIKYVKDTKEKFDVVIIDSTDPIGPAEPLFNIEFYQDIERCLTDDGIVVSQGESPFYNVDMQHKLLGILKETFPLRGVYNFCNQTYPGGLWSFTLGSKKYHPITDYNPTRVDQLSLKFKYYNKELHTASFTLPSFMRENLREFINL